MSTFHLTSCGHCKTYISTWYFLFFEILMQISLTVWKILNGTRIIPCNFPSTPSDYLKILKEVLLLANNYNFIGHNSNQIQRHLLILDKPTIILISGLCCHQIEYYLLTQHHAQCFEIWIQKATINWCTNIL